MSTAPPALVELVSPSPGGPPPGAPTGGDSCADASSLASAFTDFWRQLQGATAGPSPLPELTLSARRLQVQHAVPSGASDDDATDRAMPTLAHVLSSQLQGWDPRRMMNSGNSSRPRMVQSLSSCSALLSPGELTLVLGPPGHGKTVLLRALAGRLHDSAGHSSASRSGQVGDDAQLRWNGMTAAQLSASGLHLPKLTALVAQSDDHYPMLSVRETFQFALQTSMADTRTLHSPQLDKARDALVEALIQTLGLSECADTNVGSSEVRGVSGGQRRRVSVGEMLLGCPRALLLDEVTSGLDASTAHSLVGGLRQWAQVARAPVVMALLQPTPEIVQLFDQLILVKEGNIVFHGTQEQLLQHWSSVGVPPPPEGEPIAEWAVKLLAEPHAILSGAHANAAATAAAAASAQQLSSIRTTCSPSPASADEGGVVAAEVVCHADGDVDVVRFHLDEEQADRATRTITTGAVPKLRPDSCTAAGMLADWETSPLHAQLLARIEALHAAGSTTMATTIDASPSLSSFVRTQFYQRTALSFAQQLPLLLGRELKAVARSVPVFSYRLFQATLMGLVLGSLFWRVGVDSDSVMLRLALIFVGIMEAAFGCMAEVPSMIDAKRVLLKQTEAGFVSEGPYISAAALSSLPVSMTETLLLGTLLYWMSDFVASPDRFLFFLLVQLLMGSSLLALFRCVAFSVESAEIAIALINPLAGLMILFAGFLITRLKIADWLIWLYWANPFTWGLNSLALNEFGSSRYPPGQGDEFLRSFEISTDTRAQWGGVGFLVVLMVLGSIIATLQLRAAKGVSGVQHAPVAKTAAVAPAPDAAATIDVGATAEAESESTGAALPFERVSLTFRDVCYSVQVSASDSSVAEQQLQAPRLGRQLSGKVSKQLLRGVTGFAKPGSITALMGSSGAGKTTLLDVLAQRKSSGHVTGSICLNGQAVIDSASTGRLLAYCEQADHHYPLSTVREAIEFSAHMRLSSDVSAEQRHAFVQRVLLDLELSRVAGRLVSSLAPGELKRLTIGVELAANSPVIFLDEPTTGLDARSALVVMRVLRRVASSGRTIVCTIHTPSREVFLLFDRLLLLQPGGRMVYFGDVGQVGQTIVDHFTGMSTITTEKEKEDASAAQPAQPLIAPPVGGAASPSVNVAVWMLDVMQTVAAASSDSESLATSPGGALPLHLPFAQHYKESALCAANELVQAELEQTHSDNIAAAAALSSSSSSSSSPSFAQPFGAQLLVVLRRLWLHHWRSGSFQLSKLSSCLILGLALGVVYYQITDDDEAGLQSRVAALLTAVVFASLILACCTIAPFFGVREAFYRETAARMYHPAAHALALVWVELPYIVVGVLLLALPFYFLVGLDPAAAHFFHFLLVLFLCGVCVSLIYQLCCAVLPTAGLAVMSSDMLFMFTYFFSGFLIPERDIPQGWIFFYHVNPFPKGLIGVVLPQWPCSDDGVGRGCELVRPSLADPSGDPAASVSKAAWVRQFVSADDGWQYYHLGYLALSAVALQMLFTIAVCKISYRSR